MNFHDAVLLESARHVAAGEVDKAVAVLRVAQTQDMAPEQKSEMLASIGQTLESAGRYDEALEAFRSGSINTSLPWCSLNAARVLARLGRLTECELREIALHAATKSRNVRHIATYIGEIQSILSNVPVTNAGDGDAAQ